MRVVPSPHSAVTRAEDALITKFGSTQKEKPPDSSVGLLLYLSLVAHGGFEPPISALRELDTLCCSISLDTILEHPVRPSGSDL